MINRCRLCLLVAMIFFSQTIIAQEKKYIIPFQLTAYNNLSVQAVLNKKDTVHLMLAIGRQKMSIIGGDILKRFNIIIDAKREYIYLKANGLKTGSYSNV